MATELFANGATTTVTSGGTTAPAAGTSETWIVASAAAFPVAVAGTSQFRIQDPSAPSELMVVTNTAGTVWTVTRAAEAVGGTTASVAHNPGFTIEMVVSAGALGNLGGTGTGTVTSVAIATANGFAGAVTTPTSTPQITLETTVSGLLKGNGTGVGAATAGIDFVAPSGNITGTAGNLSGTPTLPNGVAATTQTVGDATTKLATDAFVQTAVNYLPTQSYVSGTSNTRRSVLSLSSAGDNIGAAGPYATTATAAGQFTLANVTGIAVGQAVTSAPGTTSLGTTVTVASVNTGTKVVTLSGYSGTPPTGSYFFSGSVISGGGFCQRTSFTVPECSGELPARFRIRFRNANNNQDTPIPGSLQLNGIAIGPANTAESVWLADFASTPTNLSLSATQEMGTSEYVSAWVYPSTYQLVPGAFLGLSVGITCGTVPVGYALLPGWTFTGSGSPATQYASQAAPTGGTALAYTALGDLRLEIEWAGTNQIGLFIGDSLTAGYLGTTYVSQGHMGADNTYPQLSALRNGHHAINGGVGGTGLVRWTTTTPSSDLAFQRFFSPESGYTAFACTPDYAVIGLVLVDSIDAGSNPLATYKTNLETLIYRLNALGIKEIFLATGPPGYQSNLLSNCWEAGALATGITAAQPSTLTLAASTGGPGYSNGQPGPANSWYQGTGGPWNLYIGTPENPITNGGPLALSGATGGGVGTSLVLSVSGYGGNVTAPVGTPVLTASEYYRQLINQFVRSLPPGIRGILDFDALATSQFYYPSATGRQEFYANDGQVHPHNLGLYGLMASQVQHRITGS